MSRGKEAESPTKGSAFVAVLKTDSSGNLNRWTEALFVFNEEKLLRNRLGDVIGTKPAGYSLPGGGIRDWGAPNSRLAGCLPDGCKCETPLEGVLRELFEESGLALDLRGMLLKLCLLAGIDEESVRDFSDAIEQLSQITGIDIEPAPERIFADMQSLTAEIQQRDKDSSWYLRAAKEYIHTIHRYAKTVEQIEMICRKLDCGWLPMEFAPGETKKDRKTGEEVKVHNFRVNANNVIGLKTTTSKNDIARNTTGTIWRTRGEITKYAENYYSWLRKREAEKERRRVAGEKPLGNGMACREDEMWKMHFYKIALERLDFEVKKDNPVESV